MQPGLAITQEQPLLLLALEHMLLMLWNVTVITPVLNGIRNGQAIASANFGRSRVPYLGPFLIRHRPPTGAHPRPPEPNVITLQGQS